MTTSKVRSAQRTIQQAVENYTRERLKLYDSCGNAIYTEPEMRRRLEPLDAEFHVALEEAERLLREEQQRLDAEQQVAGREPIFMLEGEALTRATALTGIIREQIEARSPDTTFRFVGTAITANDIPTLAAFEREAGRWLEQHSTARVTGRLNDEERDRWQALTGAREQARAALQAALRPDAGREQERRAREREALAEVKAELNKALGRDRESITRRYLEQAERNAGIRVRR